MGGHRGRRGEGIFNIINYFGEHKNQGHLLQVMEGESFSQGMIMYGLRRPCVGELRLKPVRVLTRQGTMGPMELRSSHFLDWIDPALTDALIRSFLTRNYKGFYYTGRMWLL